MTATEAHGLAFAAGAAASLALAPVAMAAARRLSIVDVPGARKIHATPVPLLGGAAVLAAAAVGTAIAGGGIPAATAAATALVFAVGLADDRRKGTVSPAVRLGAESVAAALAVTLGGCRAALLPVPILDGVLTAFVLVLSANALNLSDNMNGLAAGIAATAGAALAIGHAGTEPLAGNLLAAAAGAAAGFLPFNWPRARLFLGDAGALSLGFLIPAAAMSAGAEAAPGGALVPVALAFGLPLADTALVSVSRWRRGARVFEGDRRHLSHRLVALGLSRPLAVILLVAVSLALGVASVLAARRAGTIPALAAAAVVVAALLAAAARAPRGLDDDSNR